MLKGPDDKEHKVSCVEHCDKFWAFLQSKGVNSYRSGIVQFIAEKVRRPASHGVPCAHCLLTIVFGWLVVLTTTYPTSHATTTNSATS